jgi:hypothetical protein
LPSPACQILQACCCWILQSCVTPGRVFDLRRKAPEHYKRVAGTGGEGLVGRGRTWTGHQPQIQPPPVGARPGSQAHGIVSLAPTVATAGASKHRLSIRHGGAGEGVTRKIWKVEKPGRNL